MLSVEAMIDRARSVMLNLQYHNPGSIWVYHPDWFHPDLRCSTYYTTSVDVDVKLRNLVGLTGHCHLRVLVKVGRSDPVKVRHPHW